MKQVVNFEVVEVDEVEPIEEAPTFGMHYEVIPISHDDLLEYFRELIFV